MKKIILFFIVINSTFAAAPKRVQVTPSSEAVVSLNSEISELIEYVGLEEKDADVVYIVSKEKDTKLDANVRAEITNKINAYVSWANKKFDVSFDSQLSAVERVRARYKNKISHRAAYLLVLLWKSEASSDSLKVTNDMILAVENDVKSAAKTKT
jgi:hypothetical protein